MLDMSEIEKRCYIGPYNEESRFEITKKRKKSRKKSIKRGKLLFFTIRP